MPERGEIVLPSYPNLTKPEALVICHNHFDEHIALADKLRFYDEILATAHPDGILNRGPLSMESSRNLVKRHRDRSHAEVVAAIQKRAKWQAVVILTLIDQYHLNISDILKLHRPCLLQERQRQKIGSPQGWDPNFKLVRQSLAELEAEEAGF